MPYDHQSHVDSSPALQRNDTPDPNTQPVVPQPVAGEELLAGRRAQFERGQAIARGETDLTSQPPFRK